MARKGENIYKRKDGRWEARYIKSYFLDGKAKYGYCYAASYHEVKEKVSMVKAALLSEQPAKSGNTKKRFSVCCDEWLTLNRLKVKESTFVKYYSIVHNHIEPKLGGCFVSAINSFIVEKFSQELLAEEGLSPKTVKDILVLLKSILTYTRKNYPGIMADVEIVYPKEAKKEMRVLTREEQKLFTDYLLTDMDSIKFGVLLTLMTGLRIGEICALRWSDISLTEKVIRVEATMQRIMNLDEDETAKTKIIISNPKSDSSLRMIPLTDYAVELCKMLGKQNPTDFVLSGSSEYFVEPRTLQYKLEHFTKECGLEGVHYHTLRHSFATRCVEVDFEIKSLSEILGHSSPKITLERYVHTSMELKRNNMKKLSLIGY
ncbi:MAG: site-specific integrase [Candidatus Saccharibacteria bacterium]|nr:site-specific integrase [Candidatus Saccharibacteria bacterium]